MTAKRQIPPKVVDGVKVFACGNPIIAPDGSMWVRLRPYDRDIDRAWLFSETTGTLLESFENVIV